MAAVVLSDLIICLIISSGALSEAPEESDRYQEGKAKLIWLVEFDCLTIVFPWRKRHRADVTLKEKLKPCACVNMTDQMSRLLLISSANFQQFMQTVQLSMFWNVFAHLYVHLNMCMCLCATPWLHEEFTFPPKNICFPFYQSLDKNGATHVTLHEKSSMFVCA